MSVGSAAGACTVTAAETAFFVVCDVTFVCAAEVPAVALADAFVVCASCFSVSAEEYFFVVSDLTFSVSALLFFVSAVEAAAVFFSVTAAVTSGAGDHSEVVSSVCEAVLWLAVSVMDSPPVLLSASGICEEHPESVSAAASTPVNILPLIFSPSFP